VATATVWEQNGEFCVTLCPSAGIAEALAVKGTDIFTLWVI